MAISGAKTVCRYVHSSRRNIITWRTDRHKCHTRIAFYTSIC